MTRRNAFRKSPWVPALIFPFLFACSQLGSHHLMRGSVAMKVNDREAHVCMGEGEVQAGDRVVAYENVCRPDQETPWIPNQEILLSEAGRPRCRRVKVGAGQVERTLNEHYSVVRFDDGVRFHEGTIVEVP